MPFRQQRDYWRAPDGTVALRETIAGDRTQLAE
jgi:hypothetical protein